MTAKKLLALLLAVLMLVALFSACANTEGGSDDANQSGASSDTGDTGSTDKEDAADDNGENNEPSEIEPLNLTYMGCESHQWTYTLEEAIGKGFESWNYYAEKMLENHNLVVKNETVDNESYKTTLAGLLASNSLYDCFLVDGDYMSADTMVNAISAGHFANMNDIVPNSDGTFADLIAEGGALQYIKAWSTAPDGEWYYVKCADTDASCFNFDHDDVDYINNWPVHTWYNLNIRQDWLNKCGLALPTTIEEFKEALVQFQAQDANGNGAADERAFIGLGMSGIYSDGVAQWFGLPRANFAMSAVDGALENAIEGEGYIDFVNYCAELYNAGVALLNEGGRWSYGSNTAGNYAAAQCIYPDSLLNVKTGDPDCDYEPLPIIQAVEGIAPRMMGQSATTANSAFAFSKDADYKAAAAYIDWLSSKEFFLLLTYGIEGKAWDYTEDGSGFVRYMVGEELTVEEEESVGDMWHYAPWAGFPQIQVRNAWGIVRDEYASLQDALDNGEPYTRNMLTIDSWKEQYKDYNWTDMSPLNRFLSQMNEFGTDNIRFNLNVNFTTLASAEEADIISMYGTDLTTYLDEMTTGYIVGSKTTDTYESDLQYAYDNLGMQEYMNAIQGQIDRYLVAMGRDAILG